MPCKFRKDEYRCDLGFREVELEGTLCPLHINPNEKVAFQESRRALIQAALDRVLEMRANDGQSLRLIGIVLPIGVQFGDRVVRGLTIQHSHFGGGDHFVGTTFEGETTFENSSFRDTTSFYGSRFTGAVRVHGEAGGLNFAKCAFEEDVSFHLSTNSSKAELSFDNIECAKGFTFEPSGNCNSALVLTNGKFRGRFRLKADLRNRLDLSGSAFHEKCSFDGWIRGSLAARECIFAAKVNFGLAKFEGFVDFSNSVFKSEANFVALYGSHAQFEECVFEGRADFSAPIGNSADTNSFQAIGFVDSRFLSDVLFTNRRFLSTSNFQGCSFEVAPEFHGATLHQDTRFPMISAFHQLDSENAAAAYRTLRQAMERNNARSEEAMFYALEQKTLRQIRGAQSRWENVASWAYESVSGYGVNFWRPLALLAALIFIFGLGYSVWLSWPVSLSCSFDPSRFASGQTFSFQQVVNPFWVWRTDDAKLWSESPDAIRIVATIQSLFTTGLFALSLLALRWRFKRD